MCRYLIQIIYWFVIWRYAGAIRCEVSQREATQVEKERNPMKSQLFSVRLVWKLGMLGIAALVALVGLFRPVPVKAHCDSVNGPVVTAARQALDKQDVKLVLPYVHPEAEAELTAAFSHTLEVRALGSEARELADRYFFETAVRLHRAGEGATYSGLKEETDHGPALAAAEEALIQENPDEVVSLLEEAVHHGVAERFAAVQAAQTYAAEEKTVAAQREKVEAELGFEKYVYELYNAAQGLDVAAEGKAEVATSGHSH